jgi:uncharacterized membrane protein
VRIRIALGAAVAAYAAGFAWLSVRRQDAFGTGRFDLGNMTQVVWNTAHGHFLEMTSLEGEQISRLGAHFDPILAAFAPLWLIWPSPDLLLVTQAIAIALGAIPVFRLGARHLGDRAGLAFALVYLLYPATQWLTLNEFHPVALATPLLLAAIDFLDEDRLVAFGVCAALAIATKEEVGLTVGLLGLWYAFGRGRRRTGAVIAVAGVAASAIAALVLVPHFNPGGGSPFAGRYDAVGGSPAGLVKMLATDPLRVLREAFQGHDLRYVLQLAAPLALLFLFAPLLALAALPELVLNVLSSTPTQASIQFHYSAALIPPLVAAAVLGARRFGSRTTLVALVALAVVLIANWRLGAIPLWHRVPSLDVSTHDRIAARAVRVIPDGAVVSASNSLGAHLSARRRVLSLPKLADAEWVAADETRPSYADRLAPIPSAVDLVRLRRDPSWKLVFEEDGVLVFHRRTPNSATSTTSRASSTQTSGPPAHSSG